MDRTSFNGRSSLRQPDPLCPKCPTPPRMRATLRTPHVVYFRCTSCGELLSVEKPAWIDSLATLSMPRRNHSDTE
jgi:hypothetical protein